MMYRVHCQSLINDPRHVLVWRIWAESASEARRKVFNRTRGKVKFYVIGEAEIAREVNYGDQDI